MPKFPKMLGGVPIMVGGVPSLCCCGDCMCPFATFGDAPVFTLDFDVTVYSDGADRTILACEDRHVSIPLYPDGSVDDPFACSWHSDPADELICDIVIAITLGLDPVTCQWNLGFDTAGPGESFGFTFRAGAGNYLGTYPDIDNAGSGTIVRNIVLS